MSDSNSYLEHDVKEYNLITFGCSLTYGTGLPDCLNTDDGGIHITNPSKHAWPSILGGLLKSKSVTNKSLPGLGCKQVAKTIIDYKYSSNNIVVVLWPDFNRHTIFKDSTSHSYKNLLYMVPSMLTKSMPRPFWKNREMDGFQKDKFLNLVKTYYKDYFEEWDSLFENLIRINFVHSYLKDRGIKSYHILSESQYHSESGDYFADFNLKDINLKTFNWQEDFQIDDALDKPHPHPGLLSHKLIATNIQKWFFS